MKKKRTVSRLQLYVIAAVLILLAAVPMYYKVAHQGFSLLPGKSHPVWTVEARVSFIADGGPAKVSLSIPAKSPGYKIFDEDAAAAGYGFTVDTTEGDRRAEWATRDLKKNAKQVLYYRVQVFDASGADPSLSAKLPQPEPPVWEGPQRTAAAAVLEQARRKSADTQTLTGELLRMLTKSNPSQEVKMLLGNKDGDLARMQLAIALLGTEGIPAKLARGVQLQEGKRRSNLELLLEVHDGSEWHFYNPQTGQRGLPPRFVLWQRGGKSLLDVEGGRRSNVTISVIRNVRPQQKLVAALSKESRLLDFSLFSLPVGEQNAIKKLLMIPLAAIVVILLRNIVGVKTSGTFMPILIAMAFMETKLLPGLLLFATIIGLGLIIRSHLARLNLLLVPRISAVVIVVVLLIVAVCILSDKLGLYGGLTVTFFPMIILAWTIERMSIVVEEDGMKEALLQVSGSLVVAVAAYFAMGSLYAQHLMYTFPEANLILLAIVMILGTYTGYRLSELRRFESLVRREQ